MDTPLIAPHGGAKSVHSSSLIRPTRVRSFCGCGIYDWLSTSILAVSCDFLVGSSRNDDLKRLKSSGRSTCFVPDVALSCGVGAIRVGEEVDHRSVACDDSGDGEEDESSRDHVVNCSPFR